MACSVRTSTKGRDNLVKIDLREIGEFDGVVAHWDRIALVELASQGSRKGHAGGGNARDLKT